MALVVKDRVKESTTTTGTGTLTLGGAFAGFQAFSSALSNADTTYYALFESSTGNWEVGLGTFTASGTTLARTTVLASSNSGSAINLTAAAEVFITQPASKAAYFDNSGDLLLTQDPTSNLQAATKQYVDTIAATEFRFQPRIVLWFKTKRPNPTTGYTQLLRLAPPVQTGCLPVLLTPTATPLVIRTPWVKETLSSSQKPPFTAVS